MSRSNCNDLSLFHQHNTIRINDLFSLMLYNDNSLNIQIVQFSGDGKYLPPAYRV